MQTKLKIQLKKLKEIEKEKNGVEYFLLENLKDFAKIWFSEDKCLAIALEDRISHLFCVFFFSFPLAHN